MVRRAALVACAIAWTAILGACASAPPAPPASVGRDDIDAVGRHLQQLIDHQLKAHAITGLSVAIVDDQRIAWHGAGGWADREAGVRADQQTVYRMGSITKLMTTTAVLQQVGRRRVGLDDPIRSVLPTFTIRSRFASPPITVRDLLTHHSGLPRDELGGMWQSTPVRYTTLLDTLAERDVDYPPGLITSYSNLGFDVLGAAVERLSGTPFEQALRQGLFEPVGMSGASIDAGIAASPKAARAYRGGSPVEEPNLRDLPAGGMNASVVDMSRFMMMVFADGRRDGRPIVEPALLAESLRPQNTRTALDLGFHVGLGWMLSMFGDDHPSRGGPIAHHGGATVHFRSQLMLMPEHKLGVIVAANSASAKPAVDLIAKRALALMLEARRGIRPAPVAPVITDASSLPIETLDSYVGEYATQVGHVRIRRDGRQLKARLADGSFDLVEGTDGLFGLRYSLLGLIDVPLGDLARLRLRRDTIDGRDLLIGRLGEQELLLGERLREPVPFDGDTLAGTWYPVILSGETTLIDQVRIRRQDGRWLVESRLRDDAGTIVAPLVPRSADEAILAGPLADMGPVVRRVTMDGRTRLFASGQWFEKR